jgi:hypothetical protein
MLVHGGFRDDCELGQEIIYHLDFTFANLKIRHIHLIFFLLIRGRILF